MEILQLRYFYESAKNENFTKTAQKYQVPTTSVSASVKRLEKELGCTLFDRVSNRIIINDNGKRFQQSLCAVFEQLDGAVEELSSHSSDNREIKLMVKGMRRRITNLLIEYNSNHPNVSFKTDFDFGNEDAAQYDIIIDEANSYYDEYDRIEIVSLRLCLKTSANSPLCQKELSLKDLCNQPYILMKPNSNMHKILNQACNRAGFSPNIIAFCNDIECYERLIASGMGVGIGREKDDDINVGIKDLKVNDFNERYTLYAYYKPKEYYGNLKSFVDFLKTKSI